MLMSWKRRVVCYPPTVNIGEDGEMGISLLKLGCYMIRSAHTIKRLLRGSIILPVLLCGCAISTINITGISPTPLVNKLPLTIGVYYDENFSSYSYTEINDRTGKDQLIVTSGSSQVNLFNTLLPAVFESVVQIEDMNSIEGFSNIDAILVPGIEEFQLGLPEKTNLDVYEIWVKYNLRLSKADGDYIADWVMTAYGKSPKENFKTQDEGVNRAAEIALRDMAASFAIGFSNIPGVNEWLVDNSFIE